MNTELRELIRRSTCDRESFARIQAMLPADDGELDRLIVEALGENNANEFGFIVIAALGANRAVDARHLVRGADTLTEAGWLQEIGLRMQGNVAQYLLQALDSEPVEPSHAAMILLVAATWCGERGHMDFPPDLFTKTRELIRRSDLEDAAKGYLISVALYTKDEGLLELVRSRHFANNTERHWKVRRDSAAKLVERIVDLNERPLFEKLPEREGHSVAVGDTMRRAVAQIGRNEPCPCGSGKKYKRCCLEKDRDRLRDSSDIAGITRDEILEAPERAFTPERMDIANVYEIQAIDPLKLPDDLFERYIPRLTEYRLFERLVEAFEKRGYSDNLKAAWEEAVHTAAASGRKDIAQQLIDGRKPQGFSEDQLPPATYFLMIEDDPEKCLAFIENTVRTALKSDDTKMLGDLARAVSMSKFPALGIALARSVAPLASSADASRLIEHVLRARDRLNLAPEDAMSDVLDTLAMRADEDADSSEAYRAVLEKFEAKRRESQQLREELELRRKELKRLEAARTQAANASAVVVQVSRDKSRHERKISHLEEELKASREEENTLRREMQQMQAVYEQLKQTAADGINAASIDSEMDREEELLLEAKTTGVQPVRILDFSRDFQQRLDKAPRQIASSAMVMLGRLAGGQPAAFVGAVRLKACPSVTRLRIGIDWRLLVRLLPDRVDAVDLIPRQDLERRIKTLVTQYGSE